MATWSRIVLSGSTDGRPIALTATGTPGTTIHTAATATAIIDHVYLDVFNTATTARILNIEYGGTASADTMLMSIPAQDGPYRAVDGWPIRNSLVIRAFGTATLGLNIAGWVNRAT